MQREWPGIARNLRETGVVFDEAATSRPLEALEIAQREAGNYDRIIAAGGDGTVHEVVNGLMRAGSRAALGVIPLGSGDDFAKLISSDFIFNFSNTNIKAFDVGRITSGSEIRYFANGMDIGFGAHGARNVRRVPRLLTGFGAYLGALALTMVRYPLLNLSLIHI